MSQLSIQAMSIIKIISSTFIISALLFAPLAAKASENGTESLYFKKLTKQTRLAQRDSGTKLKTHL